MVNVDTVYQRVLALANKEQRGYITPQEFNIYANHAQMEIFEQYFYDLDQFEKRPASDTLELINDKIDVFKNLAYPINHNDTIPEEVYRIDASLFTFNNDGKTVVVEKLDRKDSSDFHAVVSSSPLTAPTKNRPVYMVVGNQILFYPSETYSLGQYDIRYTRKPNKVNWTYMVVSEKPLYNSSAPDHQHFELHKSEETKLVTKILLLASVGIKDYNLTQLAAQKEVAKIQQEKQ